MRTTQGAFKLRIDVGFDFSCASLLTYGDKCERLHGHNFQVAVELEGTLGHNYFLIDFRDIKRVLREICQRLDEHTLVPLRNPLLQVEDVGSQYSISFRDRRYLLPKEDVILIDLPNLSTEVLAAYLCDKVKQYLLQRGYDNLTSISLEVKEKPGQSAVYREDITLNSFSPMR